MKRSGIIFSLLGIGLLLTSFGLIFFVRWESRKNNESQKTVEAEVAAAGAPEAKFLDGYSQLIGKEDLDQGFKIVPERLSIGGNCFFDAARRALHDARPDATVLNIKQNTAVQFRSDVFSYYFANIGDAYSLTKRSGWSNVSRGIRLIGEGLQSLDLTKLGIVDSSCILLFSFLQLRVLEHPSALTENIPHDHIARSFTTMPSYLSLRKMALSLLEDFANLVYEDETSGPIDRRFELESKIKPPPTLDNAVIASGLLESLEIANKHIAASKFLDNGNSIDLAHTMNLARPSVPVLKWLLRVFGIFYDRYNDSISSLKAEPHFEVVGVPDLRDLIAPLEGFIDRNSERGMQLSEALNNGRLYGDTIELMCAEDFITSDAVNYAVFKIVNFIFEERNNWFRLKFFLLLTLYDFPDLWDLVGLVMRLSPATHHSLLEGEDELKVSKQSDLEPQSKEFSLFSFGFSLSDILLKALKDSMDVSHSADVKPLWLDGIFSTVLTNATNPRICATSWHIRILASYLNYRITVISAGVHHNPKVAYIITFLPLKQVAASPTMLIYSKSNHYEAFAVAVGSEPAVFKMVLQEDEVPDWLNEAKTLSSSIFI